MKKIKFIIGIILVIILSVLAFAQNDTNASDNSTVSASVINETQNNTTPVEAPPESPPAEPSVVCNAEQCDSECVQCSDYICHSPNFTCIEKFDVDKITPKTTGTGINQLNILLKNTGSVDLYNLYAEVSGDGITTLERTAVDKLAAGDKDYAFVKINATKAGMIDLVVKLYMKSTLVDKVIGQLNVTEEKIAIVQETYNEAQIAANINSLKPKYKIVEAEYLAKKDSGYNVELIYNNLKETSDDIKNAQIYLSEKDFKKASISVGVINESLNELSSDLKNAKKKNITLMDKIKNNMIYFGSIAAAIISVFGAWTLIRSKSKEHIDKLKKIKIPKLKLKKKSPEKKAKKAKAKRKE